MRIDISYKTLTEVRAFTSQDVKLNPKIYLTDEGKEGEFIYDSSDTTSADNIGTILVTTSGGFRYKRKYKSNVYASWFIDTADTSGTSGNRERNAINRATTFSLAQTVCPTVILDNKRTWYVNTNAVYIAPTTGKKIVIKGEGNPVIDFLCTGNSETSVASVFRTSDTYNYPNSDYNTANGAPVFTGSITGNVLTITAVTSGALAKGMVIYDATSSLITSNTKILEFGTGTGGTGTYILNKAQSFSSATITGSAAFLAWNNRTINKGRIELEGITFDGNRNPANAGSNTVYSTPILFRQCEGVKISDCTFKTIPGTALAVGTSNNVEITSNTFDSVFARNDLDNTGDSVTIYAYCENVNVSNNKITLTTGQSGRCGISVDDFCKNAKVIDNEIIGYERGIHIETSRNIVVSNNTIQKSPIGILSAGSEQCSITGNTIDGRDVVFPSSLAATANLFVYYDTDCLYADNIVYGSYTTQNGLYNSKFWGDRINVKGNIFKNQRLVNDFTNSVTSTTSNTIPLNLSSPVNLTFTYTSNPNLIWKLNQRIRASNAAFIYVEGYITAVSATSVSIQLDVTTGNNTSYSSWTLKYAELGSVWGYGSHNDNVYTDNVFENSHLLVDENNNTIVKSNIFKSSYVSASSSSSTTGLNVKIIGNVFEPFPNDVYAKSISVFNGKKPYVADNILTNPAEYVIQNTGTTGGIYENNTYIKTDVGAAGNGFFLVDSSEIDTNITRTLRPNIIRDEITAETYYVGNTGANYFPTKVNLQIEATNTTISPNNDLYEGYVITALASALTINAPTGTWQNGQKYSFRITDNATPRAITWNSAYRGIGGSLPSTTVTSTPLYLEAEYNLGDTKWDVRIFTAGSGDALTTNPLSQFAATTSAQLAGVISDETGTGSLVFATSPTLVTPILGVASATSINKLSITAPATGSTLTINDGKTLTVSNTLTFTGTDSSSVAFGTGGTVLYSGGALGTPASGNLTNCTFPTLNQNTTGYAAAVTLTADNTTNATNYPLFANAATGNLSPRTDTGFTYNPSTGVLTSTTFAGALSGNATTATTLQTGRTINGTTFDGSANITITAAAGTLTGTTLNATVTGSSLTSVGTITSGTWSGSFGAVSGANLTNLTAANLTGTIPSAVLGNSSHFIGTTSVALNRASANQALTGILSVQLAGATSGTTTIQPTAVAGTTTITFPAVTGTVITTGDTSTVTNTMLAGSIANAKLANSTISGIALGSNLATLTISTGLTGTSYNGSGAVSIAIDSTVVTLSGSQTLTNKTLTNPVISSISNSGTITIPTGTDTIVGRATTDTLTNKRITARVQSTTSTATFTFNFDSDDIGVITAQAAGLTVTTSGTPTSMQPFVLCVKDNGTARAITWNGIFVAIGVTLPTTTVVNKHTYVSGYYNTTAAKVHIVGVTTES